MAYTRVQFRDIIRQRLGWSATDTFVTDPELNNYINDSLVELHSLLATVYRPGQWGVVLAGTTVTAGTSTAPIGVFGDFGRLVSVLIQYNNRLIPIEPGDITVDTVRLDAQAYTPWNVRYFLLIDGANSALNFSNVTLANQTILVRYIKSAPVLSADGSSSWMDWDEYVILDVLIKCSSKEEDDVAGFTNQKNALGARIRQQADPLDMGRAATVQDARAQEVGVRGDDDRGWWRRWG